MRLRTQWSNVLDRGFAKRIALFCFLAVFFASQARAAGSFSSTGGLMQSRYYHSATLLNHGEVLIAGGCDPSANALNTAELYDPLAGKFSAAGNMTTPRCGHSATLLQDGRVLIAGGTGANGTGALSSAEVYDPLTGTFTPTTGPMTMARMFNVAALLQNGMVLIAGGRNATGILSSAELYDPSAGTFTPTTVPMTTPREGSDIWLTPSAVLNDGSVLIAGGYDGANILSTADLFSPPSQAFTATTGNMTTPRWYHQLTQLQNGTVLITAGINLSGSLNSAEIYDPSTGTFTPTSGNLSDARIGHTSTLLTDGTVLVAGGRGIGSVILSSSELYDPAAKTFIPTASLQTARMLHTATLLQNGSVLIAGGYSGMTAVSTAEVFTPGTISNVTYYISYSSGSNTNNGTSKSTPWKTHPYMQSSAQCTGNRSAPTYTHSAGDIFVFQQGDSWPNACFDMVIQSGGNPGNPDQYTFDSTWGVAPSGITGNRGQTVGMYQFNAGGSVINGTDGINRFVYDLSNDNVTINGVELTGVTWDGTGGGGHNVYLVDIEGSQNFILSNCYVHNWTYTNPVDGGDALAVMVGVGNANYNAGSAMSGCVVDGSNSGGPGVANSGDATYAIPGCDNNIIENVTNGCLLNANGSAHDNLIGPINKSLSAGGHENCIEPIDPVAGGTNTINIYNNVIHDCTSVAVLTQGTPAAGSNEIDYVWNNVIYVGSVPNPPIPLQFDSRMNPNTGSEVHAWNNTIYAGPNNVCVRTINEGNGNFSAIDLQNNFCISDHQGAMTVPVQNPSFETTIALNSSCGMGCAFNYDLGIPGWTVTGGGGSFQPSSAYLTLPAGDGQTVAFSDGGMISQVLTSTLQANVTYTLSADVGHRLDGYATGYTIELVAGGNVLNSVTGNSADIPAGALTTESVSYTSPAMVTPGQLLEIRLIGAGAQSEFDNIKLTVKSNSGLMNSQTYSYHPTSWNCGGVPNCPVGAGTNLTGAAAGNFATLGNDTTYGATRTPKSRPSTGAWDAGAYQY